MQIGVLVGILSTLLTKKRTTTDELSLKYEVSYRTIMRYIDALSEGGVPIVSYRGRNGGYGIIDSYKMSSAFFSKEEYERMISSIESMPHDQVTESILDKLKATERAEKRLMPASDSILIDTTFSPAFENKFKALQNAIRNHFVTEITYFDKFGTMSVRDIQPHTLVFKDGVWYIFAYCDMRDDFRFFKLNRIVGVKLSESTFTQREYTLDTSSLNSFLSAKEHIDLSFYLDAEALVEVQEWLGEESVVKKGTGYVAFARVPYDDFLLNRLINFGDKIKILKPLKLQTDYLKRLNKLQSIYQLPERKPN